MCLLSHAHMISPSSDLIWNWIMVVTKCTLVAILTALRVVTVSAVALEEFYPYGLPDNKQILTNDDGSSLEIHLDPPLRFYGRNYNTCHVHNNGIVSFNEPPEHFIDDPFPIANHILVAPFFGDVDTRKAGTLWYTDPVSNDSISLKKATEDIFNETFADFGCDTFSPKYVVIATWDHVGYFKEQSDKKNTFQCVLATDGNRSYAIFLYNEIEWTTQYDPDDPDHKSTPAKVGFNDGYLNKSYEVPCSRKPEIVNISMSSNVGKPGVWIFRIDGEEIVSACQNEKTFQCNEGSMCSNGQTCLTADYEFNCVQSSEVCEKPTDGVGGSGTSLKSFIMSVFVPLVVLVCL